MALAEKPRERPNWRSKLRDKRRPRIIIPAPFDGRNSFLSLDGSQVMVTKEAPSGTQNVIFLADRRAPQEATHPSLSAVPDSATLSLDEIYELIKSRESTQVVKTKRKPNRFKNMLAGAVLALSVATGVAKVAPGMVNEGSRIQDAFSQNQTDVRLSELPTDQFIKEYKVRFPNAKLGFTFSPEEMGLTPEIMHTKEGEKIYQQVLDTLDKLIKVYGFKEVRLGLRWNIPFEFYVPFMDKIIEDGADLVPNFGPKVNHWPELHVPVQYQAELKRISENGGVMHMTDNIAVQSIVYIVDTCKKMKARYTPEQLKHFTSFQINNEAKTRFGPEPIEIGDDVQEASIIAFLKEFPDAKIDMNSAGPLNIKQIINFYKHLFDAIPSLKTKKQLIIAVDDYSVSFGKIKLNFFGDVDPENDTPLGKINTRFIDRVWNNDYQTLLEFSRKYDVPIRIDEAGLSWGDEVRPDPVKDAKYELVSASEILDPDVKSVVMIWDIQKVMENKEILKIFRAINIGNESSATETTPLGVIHSGNNVSTLVLPPVLARAA